MKAKTVGSYTHGPFSEAQQVPDTQPGDYYVTLRDDGRTAFLLGPYRDDHEAALANVGRARAYVQAHYPRAVWWSFGTCRIDSSGSSPVGKLNGILPMVEAA